GPRRADGGRARPDAGRAGDPRHHGRARPGASRLMRIRELRAFPLHLQRPDRSHVGTAGLHGAWQGPAEAPYHRVVPYRALYSAHIESLRARVRTDDGAEGWGESQAPVAPEAVGQLVERLLASVVVGRDAREVDALWLEMYEAMHDRGHTTGFMLDAIAGVDQALWDPNRPIPRQPVWRPPRP